MNNSGDNRMQNARHRNDWNLPTKVGGVAIRIESFHNSVVFVVDDK